MGWASGTGGLCNHPLVVCYLPMSERDGGRWGEREREERKIERRERQIIIIMQSSTSHSIQENRGPYHAISSDLDTY